MPITTTEKLKISQYLRETPIDYINYYHMKEAMGNKSKISLTEYLEYFTDCAINVFKKNEVAHNKQTAKYLYLIAAFLEFTHQEKQEIKEYTLDKIRSFDDFYDEYLKRTNTEKDENFYEEFIMEVLKTVNELYPAEKEKESVSEYINKISELEEQIKKLKKELEEEIRLHEILKKDYTQKEEKNTTLIEKTITLEKEIKNKEKELKQHMETIDSLTEKIKELEESISNLENETNELKKYKEIHEQLLNEIEQLKNIIESYNQEEQEEENNRKKTLELISLVYKKILLERVTVDELLKYIQESGITTTKEEIKNVLKNIKSKINIDSSIFTIAPTYKVENLSIEEDGKFTLSIPKNCKYYDIMLIADVHLKEFSTKVLSDFDVLNNYCINNNINLILNLGDFYHGTPGSVINYENAIKNYNLIEQSIELLPKAEGIYHGLLGGNHEMKITNYGFDPLKILSEERNDFINLGYTHSTIYLNGANKIIGEFDIHHPHTFDFPIELDENGINSIDLSKYLNSVYTSQSRTRDESYIDILGHTHRSQFNYPNSYCYIPTFQEGVCHLRIYFDNNTKIRYMVFMPLIFNNKLIKTNEIVYSKKLKNKI